MNNIMDFTKFIGKMPGDDVHIYTLSEFINVMNGEGFDDSEYKIYISPFADGDDGYIEGWWIGFINAEMDQYCVVAQDDHNGINDFILYHKPIEIIFETLNGLDCCERIININHKNEYDCGNKAMERL